MNKKEIITILEDNSDCLKEQFGVSQIGLFGSFVRGKEEEDSDVDLLVSFRKGRKDFFNYMRTKYYLEDLLGREVDLVTKPALKERIKDHILNQVEYVD